MCENGVGVDQLVFAGNERPGGGEVVIIFAIDDRIGAGLAELGFLEGAGVRGVGSIGDRIGEARGSEEHTSELQSLMRTSYAVCCLKKKINIPGRITSLYTHPRLSKH